MKTLDEEFEEMTKLELNALSDGLKQIKETQEALNNSLNVLKAYIKAIGTINIKKITAYSKDGYEYDLQHLVKEVEKEENGI